MNVLLIAILVTQSIIGVSLILMYRLFMYKIECIEQLLRIIDRQASDILINIDLFLMRQREKNTKTHTSPPAKMKSVGKRKDNSHLHR